MRPHGCLVGVSTSVLVMMSVHSTLNIVYQVYVVSCAYALMLNKQ